MATDFVVQILFGVLGAGGLTGAVVALYKLRPDVNSAAVTQSQGAMETMRVLNEQLESDRDYWRKRAIDSERAQRTITDDCRQLREHVQRLEALRARHEQSGP